MSFTNRAAYLVDKELKPLQVRSAPYTKPGPNEIVIKAHAVAINPVDLIVQTSAKLAFGYMSNLHVLGHDVAGHVVEVGKNVDTFQLNVGDRVVGQAVAFDKRSNGSPEGAFQEYVVLRSNLVAKIPNSISSERASVIPLGLSTAACGLFQKDFLGLAHPDPTSPMPQEKTLVVWGGSTSVGINAIQLARAAGYSIITTSSPKNFDFVKSLGASEAFDYADPKTPDRISEHLKGKTCAGAVAIGNGSLEACIAIVGASQGSKTIAQMSVPLDFVQTRPSVLEMMKVMLLWRSRMLISARIKGVTVKMVNGSDLMMNEVGKAVYTDFLGQALTKGTFVPKPDPYVVGHGLEAINEAMEYYRGNQSKISAVKVVVTL